MHSSPGARGHRAPVVSVILTTHNFEEFVDAAIRSVLAQTFEDYELIVVDDGSTDRTLERAAAHVDPRLSIISTDGRGAPESANLGLGRARGKYFALWDGDDLWRPSKLARHVEAMERDPALALTFSWCGLMDASGREVGGGFRRWRGPLSLTDLLRDFVIGTNSTVLFRREAILVAGGFDETLSHCYDMGVCLELARVPGAVSVIEEELTLYRRHERQMSRDWRPIKEDWERILSRLRDAAPREVEAVEKLARSNMQRYFAFLAYEAGRHGECLSLLWTSLLASPALFLREPRNLQLLAACLARTVLSRGLADRIEGSAVRLLRGRSHDV